jgi:hypothetical protein
MLCWLESCLHDAHPFQVGTMFTHEKEGFDPGHVLAQFFFGYDAILHKCGTWVTIAVPRNLTSTPARR